MTFNDYQSKSKETAIYPKIKGLEYCILGLLSEAGEVAGKYKKIIRDNNGVISEEKREDLIKESADCLWYISQIFTELDCDFGAAAQQNIEKLFSRKERGVLGGSGDNR